MYIIKNKSNVFYILDLQKNTLKFVGDKNNFINAITNIILVKNAFFRNPYHYSYNLNCINFSGKDTIVSFDFFERQIETSLRRYVVYDGYGRIIDVRIYLKEIIEKIKQEEQWAISKNNKMVKTYWGYYFNDRKYKEYQYDDIRMSYGVPYRFRSEPVPFVHSYNGGPCSTKKVGHLLRMIKHPDFQEYNRVSHYETLLKDICDYEYRKNRCVSKSWKDKKIKKQWQKNLKTS